MLGSQLVNEGPVRYTIVVYWKTLKLLMIPTPVLSQDYASYAGTGNITYMLVTFYVICDTLTAGNLSEQTTSVAL